jgi:plastocyanin
MRLVHPALLLLALVTVLACSSSGTSAAEPVATTEVQLPKSYRFEPAAITVPVGATVTWTNDDNFTHNVAFEGSEPMKLSPGDSTMRTFDTAGTFPYQCTLHSQDMQGTVEVTAS